MRSARLQYGWRRFAAAQGSKMVYGNGLPLSTISPAPRSRVFPAVALTVVLVVAFCLGLLRANPLAFWNDDYQISILPVLADVARSWQEGHWPLLSPYSWACGNLAGEYQYGTFSLFVNAVVVAVWQFPMSFGARAAALSIVHLAVLAAGGCLLAHQRRLPSPLVVMVGIVSALNGWEIGWGATNWFGALAAHAWLPWAWWAFEVAMAPSSDPSTPRQRLRWLLPVPFVYLVLTGGFPYTVVMLMLISAWLAVKTLAERRAKGLVPLVLGWAFGLGLSAPAWLSLLEAMRGSGRAAGVGTGNAAWTVPLSSLPGAILPSWSTHWHNFSDVPSLHAALELAGAFVPVVGVIVGVACLRARFARACRWDLALLGVVLLLCLLPTPGVFRWSFRWLPLLHIVLALAGARAWELLTATHDEYAGPKGIFSWTRLQRSGGFWASVAVAAAWLGMAACGAGNPDAITRALPLWTLGFALAWLAVDLASPGTGRWRLWLPTAVALLTLWVTYRHLYTNPGVPRYAFDASLARPEPLSPERLYLSLYPAPEKNDVLDRGSPARAALLRPGSTNLFAGLRFVNGYTPIMGPGIARAWRVGTHGEVPPDVARQLLVQDPSTEDPLQRLGIDGLIIAANYPIDAPPLRERWEPVFSSPDGTVYHAVGRAFSPVAAQYASGNGVPPPPVTVIENTRQRVVVDLSAQPYFGLLFGVVFQRPYFPGYVASLDGVPIRVHESVKGPMPVVYLGPGRHSRLVLTYRPRALVWGAAMAGLALLGICGVGALLWRAGGADAT